jgi:hypothetical protein
MEVVDTLTLVVVNGQRVRDWEGWGNLIVRDPSPEMETVTVTVVVGCRLNGRLL